MREADFLVRLLFAPLGNVSTSCLPTPGSRVPPAPGAYLPCPTCPVALLLLLACPALHHAGSRAWCAP